METGGGVMTTTEVVATRGGSGIRIENPFTVKVGQVFTGFGVGCGVGIGVGRPINLGAVPMVGEVMSAARGATDALSGVGRHVNAGLRKIGAKGIEAGIGCGVGFGHGFGIGLAVKPSALHQFQSCVMETATKLMVKIGVAPNMLLGKNLANQPSNQNLTGSQMTTPAADQIVQGQHTINRSVVGSEHGRMSAQSIPADASFARTEKVLSSFLQNPLLNDEKSTTNEPAGQLRKDDNVLQMVLKHQQVIDELMEENEKLRQILVQDLGVPVSRLQHTPSLKTRNPCIDCFECRRKQRR